MGNYDSDDYRSRPRKHKKSSSSKRQRSRSYSRSSSSSMSESSSDSRSYSKKSSSSSRHRSSKHTQKKRKHKHRSRSHSRSGHSRRSRSRSGDRSHSSRRRHKSKHSSSSSKHKKKHHHHHKKRYRSSSPSSSDSSTIDDSRGSSNSKNCREQSSEKYFSNRAASKDEEGRSTSEDYDRKLKSDRRSTERGGSIVSTLLASGVHKVSLTTVKEDPDDEKPMFIQNVVDFSKLSESDKLRRDRAIADIQDSSFMPAVFKSSRGDKVKTENSTVDKGTVGQAEEFNFGTSAELKSRDIKLMHVEDNSLFSPYLFGDPEEREEKYLKRILSIRQRVYDNMITAATAY